MLFHDSDACEKGNASVAEGWVTSTTAEAEAEAGAAVAVGESVSRFVSDSSSSTMPSEDRRLVPYDVE